jgi:hypothetical protein
MFDTVSFDLDALGDSKPPIGYADFEFLRDHPYFCALENTEVWRLTLAHLLVSETHTAHVMFSEEINSDLLTDVQTTLVHFLTIQRSHP